MEGTEGVFASRPPGPGIGLVRRSGLGALPVVIAVAVLHAEAEHAVVALAVAILRIAVLAAVAAFVWRKINRRWSQDHV